MENGEFKILLDKLDDQSEKIGALYAAFSGHKATTEVKIAALEKQDDKDRFWNNIKAVVIIPVMAMLHQVAYHMGWIR